MWPMSNALYPGLASPTDRPTTSGTEQSWYTYGSRRYSASNYSRSNYSKSKAYSSRRSARTGRTGETEGGEDLRDLLRQSQQALTNLPPGDDDREDFGVQSSPEDGDSDVTPYGDSGARSWKKPIWRSLSRRTAATGATGMSAMTTDSIQQDPVPKLPGTSSSSNNRRRGSSARPPTSNRHPLRSKHIPSVASRMENDEHVPDPVPSYQEVDVSQQAQPPPQTPQAAVPSLETPRNTLKNDFQATLSRLEINSTPSISTMSFTNMGDNGAGISFSKVDYDEQDASRGNIHSSHSPRAVAFATTPYSNNPFLAAPGRAVSPLAESDDIRDQMQARVVTFSNYDEIAIDSGADSRSVTAPTVDTWERSDSDHEKTAASIDELPTPPATTYLYGLPLVAVIVALSLAVFLVAMDVNVIATAVPHITGEFRSLDDVGWYGSAFLMTTCAFQILFGRIYTLFPAKWTFLFAIGVFMGGSLIAALAPSSVVFIIGRAVQGIGTSGILSGGLIIIAQVVPLQMRSVLGGVIGAMEGVAMISAPIIGGALTDKLSWRWCFYINLPIGGFVLIAVLIFLRIPEANRPQKAADRSWRQTAYELDLIGAALLVPPIVCFLLALQYGGTTYAWNSIGVILLFVLGFVLFLAFAYSQHVNADVAMIPSRIIKKRSVLAGFWYILCTSSALVIMTYFLPLWYQTVQNATPTQSGLHLLPMLIGVIVGVLGSGALVSGLGYFTPFMIVGTILMSVGIGLLSTIVPDTSNALLIVFPGLFGLGVGIGFQQPLIGAQTVLSKEDIPIGTSIIVFGQTIGAAVVLSVGESVFQNQLKQNIESYLGIVVQDAHSLMTEGTSALAATLSADQVPKLIAATSKSLTQTFYVALAMAALSIAGSLAMEWKSVKKVAQEQEAAAMAQNENEKSV
ncbi:major facilitator superfamily transporter [Seiridium cupressi]